MYGRVQKCLVFYWENLREDDLYGGLRYRWGDHIKMDLREVGFDTMELDGPC